MGWAFWRTEAEPAADTSAGASTSTPTTPALGKFERTLLDEEKVQQAQFPTADDVPTCMRLLCVCVDF